ncbi:MAG: hypothetical protein QM539_00230 [Alphaproteobacteria bacterium]|nr:hypothetical protein [Alphaproteobacteria bacterium]
MKTFINTVIKATLFISSLILLPACSKTENSLLDNLDITNKIFINKTNFPDGILSFSTKTEARKYYKDINNQNTTEIKNNGFISAFEFIHQNLNTRTALSNETLDKHQVQALVNDNITESDTTIQKILNKNLEVILENKLIVLFDIGTFEVELTKIKIFITNIILKH